MPGIRRERSRGRLARWRGRLTVRAGRTGLPPVGHPRRPACRAAPAGGPPSPPPDGASSPSSAWRCRARPARRLVEACGARARAPIISRCPRCSRISIRQGAAGAPSSSGTPDGPGLRALMPRSLIIARLTALDSLRDRDPQRKISPSGCLSTKTPSAKASSQVPAVEALEYSVARPSKKFMCSTALRISSSQGSGFLSVL